MLAFLLRRLALVVPTFLGITLIAFSLIHVIPGDPVQVMAGERRLDPVFYAETLARLGLDRPLWEQYLNYLWKALHLDLVGPVGVPGVLQLLVQRGQRLGFLLRGGGVVVLLGLLGSRTVLRGLAHPAG